MKYAIFVYDNVEPIDIGAAAGVLSIAIRFDSSIDYFIVAENIGEITLTNGLRILSEYNFSNCPEFDILVVLGGPGWSAQCENIATLDFIRSLKKNVIITSVCTGALILAAAGVLENQTVTTRRLAGPNENSPLEYLKKRTKNAKIEVADLVDSGKVITGGGVTLALDLMFHLLKRFHDEHIYQKTARLMEYDRAIAANKNFFENKQSLEQKTRT